MTYQELIQEFDAKYPDAVGDSYAFAEFCADEKSYWGDAASLPLYELEMAFSEAMGVYEQARRQTKARS